MSEKEKGYVEGRGLKKFNEEFPDGTCIVDRSELDDNYMPRRFLEVYIEGVNVDTIRYDHIGHYRVWFIKAEKDNMMNSLNIDLGEFKEDGDFHYEW